MRGGRILRAVVGVAGVVVVVGAAVPAAAQYDGRTLNTVLSTRLTGEAEVDAGGTPGQGDPDGIGIASIVLEAGSNREAAGDDACARLIVSGLGDVTMAHIHQGAAGTNGPIVVPLPAPAGGASGGCVPADPAVMDAIAANPAGYYVNVHTADFPNGAVRGQLAVGPGPLTAQLDGAAEVDASGLGFQGDPDGVGEAVVLADPAGLVCVTVRVSGIDPPSAGHIHAAGLRANGPIVVPFTQLPTAGRSVECIETEVAVASGIGARPADHYVNLHNGAYPSGAVRGQLAPGFTSARFVERSGRVLHLVDANDAGSTAGLPLAAPVVDAEATSTGRGYWLAAADGGVFSFGDAVFAGSAGGLRLNAPVVGLSAIPTASGYWLVASDGGVFTYGGAGFFGSAASLPLRAPVVGMASTPTARGYWLVAADGGVFAYGDARFLGSVGGVALAAPIVAMAPTPSGLGYWLLGADGGVFSFGDATYLGRTFPEGGPAAMVDIAALPVGAGYRMVGRSGESAAFGEAPSLGLLVDPGQPELAVTALTG